MMGEYNSTSLPVVIIIYNCFNNCSLVSTLWLRLTNNNYQTLFIMYFYIQYLFAYLKTGQTLIILILLEDFLTPKAMNGLSRFKFTKKNSLRTWMTTKFWPFGSEDAATALCTWATLLTVMWWQSNFSRNWLKAELSVFIEATVTKAKIVTTQQPWLPNSRRVVMGDLMDWIDTPRQPELVFRKTNKNYNLSLNKTWKHTHKWTDWNRHFVRQIIHEN